MTMSASGCEDRDLHYDYYVLRSPTTTIYYPLEQPIFTTKAHVFQIDPSTKKKWLPASTQAVNVSYYYDSTRNTHRIISVEGSKAVINSTITPNMTFTKTSQKFGQWTDPKANTVYGLGFTSEAELLKFVEKFKEVKELTRQATTKAAVQTNGQHEVQNPPPAHPPPETNSNSPVNVAKVTQNEINERRNSTSSSSTEAQLKYENDRLKIALAQSSANAKKWEVELQTLKNNNARLTTALQESTANVEEWKKQLAAYKEESARMKKRVTELERTGGAGDENKVRELSDRIQQLEMTNRHKEEELSEQTKKLDALRSYEAQHVQISERFQTVERENTELRQQLQRVEEQLGVSRSSQTRERQQLKDLTEQMTRKLQEMTRLNEQASSTLQHT